MNTHTPTQFSALNSLFSGGQLKAWSIPVAESRAVTGITCGIDEDEENIGE
jgi:hypothetical protein